MSGNTNNTVFIQRLFTSRDNFVDGNVEEATANIASFVGQEGRIWWNPVLNAFYYSDGSTPGGIPVGTGESLYGNANVANYLPTYTGTLSGGNITIAKTANLGNFTISNQTITGKNDGQSIRISPVGNAKVDILNGISVYQGNFDIAPLFSISNIGVVTTIIPPTGNIGAFEIVGNPAGNTVSPQLPGVMLHTTGIQGTPTRIYNDGVANYGAVINRRYNGTSSSPTGVLDNQIMGRIGATPYLIDAGWPNISTTRVDFVSSEDQTTTGQGSEIQMWAVPMGTTNPVIVGQFKPGEILVTGNVVPNSTVSSYSLGNATHKWGNLYLGPDSLFIEDTVTHVNTELTVNNGTLFINGTQRVQIGNMQMTTTGISLVANASSQNITIGRVGDTGNTEILNAGIEFPDHTLQATAAIPLNYLGNAFGVATLDSGGKVPSAQLPAGATMYKGIWNASTNIPTLTNGTGSAGDEYSVSTAGTVNFGSGPITFAAGDFVIYSGTVWQKIPTAIGVASFNTRTGAVTLSNADVITALNSSSITNSKLANPNVTITTGQGLNGGGVLALGGSLTLTPTVANILPGTGVNVAISSGNYTISIGQPVGTANSVQFLAVSANTTIQAAGNVIGGNLVTIGKVVATGNIETSGYLVTSNTTINSSIISNGNVSFTGANVTLGTVANVHITGGSAAKFLTTDGTGNLSWANVAGANITGQVANALISGTVYTNAQPNITSVGTLTSLAVTGNIFGANVTATHYGAATGLTGIPGANVTGTVANATYATSAGSATTAGTVTTAAQPNITSVGTLTSLVVTGNITTGNLSGANLITSNFFSGSGNLLSNIQGANVSGAVAFATTATNLSAASSILAGTFSLAVNVSKNSLTTLTQTITGLTTGHKVIIMPATVMPDNQSGFGAAWASSANTLSIQFSNPGGAVNTSFNISYFAFV